VSLLQPAALDASLQNSVVDSQRILHLEQALQQQRQKLLEAVEDINLAHAKDRAQLHQSNRDCVASIENVRHDFLDVSTRLNSLEEAYLESKSTAASGQVAVASCLSDLATHRATVEDLQRNVQQLQQAFDSAQPTRGQQLGTESILNEMKLQCQHLQLQLESMQQQQLLYAQLENRQNQLSERLIAIEQSARQLQEHQHAMQHRIESQLEQFRQQDRDDIQRLVEDKFAAMSLRMTQLESHRESWTALERLVLSSSSSNSGNGHQALTLSDKVDHHEHCSGAHEIDGSYVSLQTSYVAPVAATETERRPFLQITSVSVRFRHPNQDATTQLQLHARGGDICPSDADFAVSIGVNELAILDLQVTVQNVSNLSIPEDVELRLVSKSRGVATATQTMHTTPRTRQPMQPGETFTFIVCCTAPAIATSFPSRFLWQPYSAGLAVGASLAVFLDGRR